MNKKDEKAGKRVYLRVVGTRASRVVKRLITAILVARTSAWHRV